MSHTTTYIDTHCHIHDDEFFTPDVFPLIRVVEDAVKAGVQRMICVGTDVKSSQQAVKAAEVNKHLYSSVALHPHEAAKHSPEELETAMKELVALVEASPDRIVAIGECGLDYFYHSSEEVKDKQKNLLRMHLELASKHQLPVIFHVRNAFDDFYGIFDEYQGLRGVLHSFTDTTENMKKAINRGLYIGLNGIMTFTKDESQLEMAKRVPLDSLVLETDAPFLTPKPFRGKICKPEHVRLTAEFLSKLRQEPLDQLAQATTVNAKQLFTIK